jgi:oligoribonuclease (3'-5' exoribonuclease)
VLGLIQKVKQSRVTIEEADEKISQSIKNILPCDSCYPLVSNSPYCFDLIRFNSLKLTKKHIPFHCRVEIQSLKTGNFFAVICLKHISVYIIGTRKNKLLLFN